MKGSGGVRKRLRQFLRILNPTKLRCCQALVRFHEAQGDKVIVFADDIFVLDQLEKLLGQPHTSGKTDTDERIRRVGEFRASTRGATIIFSRVGDTSLDIPEANVIVQVAAHYGSRCQETQRFGRISRPKKRDKPAGPGEADAFFYTLLSEGTDDIEYGERRQQFLRQKGYTFISVSGDDIVAHHKECGGGGGGRGGTMALSSNGDVTALLRLITEHCAGHRAAKGSPSKRAGDGGGMLTSA